MRPKTNRIHSIDGLRGWSLIGILLANLLIFQYGIYGMDEISYFNLTTGDSISYYFTKIFIESSFMPIFAFLFGYSLILMKNNLEKKQLRVKWHLFRRCIVLISFGLLHSIFLWEGDILFLYGMSGIFLLMFINRKPKTLLIWTIILFVLFFGLSLINSDDIELVSEQKMTAYLDDTLDIYKNGTYQKIKYHRNNVDPIEIESGAEVFAILVVLPIFTFPPFLFGMYAAKKGWLRNPNNEKKWYLKGMILCIPIGLFLKIAPLFKGIPLFHETSESGGIILSLGYLCLFAYAYTKPGLTRTLTAFENVGKLSLSNYILQTIICTFIFYGYGLGLFGSMGVTVAMVTGIFIFTLQVVGSTIYLKYFRQGVLERIMRTFVYLRFNYRNKQDLKNESYTQQQERLEGDNLG